MHPLSPLFHPQTIAVIGASDRYGSTGRAVFGQLLAQQSAPHIIPVNIHHKTIGGIKAYANLSELAEEHTVDTVIVILSADKMAGIVREAAKVGVQNIIIINDLEQVTPQIRSKLERAADAANKARIRLLAIPTMGLDGLFHRQQSACAYLGQSAGIADCMLHYAKARGMVFSRFITVNPQEKDTVCTGQIVDFLAAESDTHAILVHINMLDNTRALLSALTAAARTKSVFVLSTLPEGTQETLFHQALERHHIFTVHTLTEWLTIAKLLHTSIGAHGRRIGIISNTPQISALSLKSLPHIGLTLAQTSSSTHRALSKHLPHKLPSTNPLYLSADSAPSVFQAASELFLQDEQIDAVCVIYAGANHADSRRVAQMVGALQHRYPRKPLLMAWLGSADHAEIQALFNQNKNLHFRQPDHALNAVVQLNRYREYRHSRHHTSTFYDYRAAAEAAAVLREQLAPAPEPNHKTNTSQLFNVLDDALDGLQKHLRPLLPVSKTLIGQVLKALKLQASKKSEPQCLFTWKRQPHFGQVLSLTTNDHHLDILPPLTPEIATQVLNQIDLPNLIWHDWLLEAVEVLCRLPEVAELSLTIYHDVKRGLCGSDVKIQLNHEIEPVQQNIFTPYPFEYESQTTLANGQRLNTRPIRAEDADLLSKHIASLSEHSREMRLMSQSPTLSPAVLARLSQPDYQREFALIIHDDDLQPIAIAHYTADNDGYGCEFGISLLDDWQGQGIGTMLMTQLITHARQRGFHHIRAEILANNHPMQKLAFKLGFTLSKHQHDAGLVEAILLLNPPLSDG